MSRNETTIRFADLADSVDKKNQELRTKRFFVMKEFRNGKVVEFGVYDGQRKKYVLTNVFDTSLNERLTEIERMLER